MQKLTNSELSKLNRKSGIVVAAAISVVIIVSLVGVGIGMVGYKVAKTANSQEERISAIQSKDLMPTSVQTN